MRRIASYLCQHQSCARQCSSRSRCVPGTECLCEHERKQIAYSCIIMSRCTTPCKEASATLLDITVQICIFLIDCSAAASIAPEQVPENYCNSGHCTVSSTGARQAATCALVTLGWRTSAQGPVVRQLLCNRPRRQHSRDLRCCSELVEARAPARSLQKSRAR